MFVECKKCRSMILVVRINKRRKENERSPWENKKGQNPDCTEGQVFDRKWVILNLKRREEITNTEANRHIDLVEGNQDILALWLTFSTDWGKINTSEVRNNLHMKVRKAVSDSSPQIDLQIQQNSYQNPSRPFWRNCQADPKIYTEMQRT